MPPIPLKLHTYATTITHLCNHPSHTCAAIIAYLSEYWRISHFTFMFVWKQLEQLVKTTSSFSPRNCAAFSNAGLFPPHTKNKLFSTGLFPIFKCTPENYCDNPLRTSHIAICEIKGTSKSPHTKKKSKGKQYHALHPKPFQSLKMSHASHASHTSYWTKAKRKAHNLPPIS